MIINDNIYNLPIRINNLFLIQFIFLDLLPFLYIRVYKNIQTTQHTFTQNPKTGPEPRFLRNSKFLEILSYSNPGTKCCQRLLFYSHFSGKNANYQAFQLILPTKFASRLVPKKPPIPLLRMRVLPRV